VTVLLDAAQLAARRHTLTESLRALADSLAADLDPVLARELLIPSEKARMTRRGGRCERDGTLLDFDPFSPRAHRCPRCGTVFDDDAHYRWWIMGYQLWLAERSVHAAALYTLCGDERHRDFARAVLEGYAERYLQYPNKDNVLGPTRVFFSTYLESIWLLQLVVALDLLEMSTPLEWHGALGQRVRDRVIAPSAALLASYDEGLSNRQVWNNAALLASSRLLDSTLNAAALDGPSGLTAHLTTGLLGDGTWYEGENYHLFAHRGLWYGVTIADVAGFALTPALVARFDEAFATPFVTALPDFTFPSRRDSQYGVSLRQWRFAELAELGLVRQPGDERLRGALGTLYDDIIPRHDTGRARSTAEAERNTPATALDRTDLGWRSLLFALGSLPALTRLPPRSALLADQGFAILRREQGQLYAALDYGHSGAGHGHPDRLNVMLVRGNDRWLDDVGTGSYVDPSLHWYRSTLAHNAPLVNGRSQRRTHGALAAYEDRGGAGWVRAFVDGVAPGVRLQRTIVAMPNYLIDELTWEGDREVLIDLPFHVDGDLEGVGAWRAATPQGGTEAEDGFGFLTNTETAASTPGVRLQARLGASVADARVLVEGPHAWWRAVSYGAPGSGAARFHFVRARARQGSIVTVWDLQAAVANAAAVDRGVVVSLRDGARHDHRGDAHGWHVATTIGGATSSSDLRGVVDQLGVPAPRDAPAPSAAPIVIPRLGRTTPAAQPIVFGLHESHYRRSEHSWHEAGEPTATVSIAVENDSLAITVDVAKVEIHFAPASDWNPLDNEHPDTNSDGIQLHLVVPSDDVAAPDREISWLMVPEPADHRVRIASRPAVDASVVSAAWNRTSSGYRVRCMLPIAPLGISVGKLFLLGVIVNETTPDRERRRGQLVLGGVAGEFVYLRGDRLPADRHLPFVITDV
jgi:hypothetical protein